MPTKDAPKFGEPKPADDAAETKPLAAGQTPSGSPPNVTGGPATGPDGDAPLVAPLAKAGDQATDPAQPDMDQLNTSSKPPQWPESTEVKSREGEPGQGETDPALVPAGLTSPTPA